MNILESILDFSLPRQDYGEVLNALPLINTSHDIPDDLILKILNHEGEFNMEVSLNNMPSSRSPDEMVQFIALQYLIKKTGDKYREQLLKIPCKRLQRSAENFLKRNENG